MRILMILENSFPPDVRVEKEIKSLIDAGHKILLACSSPNAENKIFDWYGAEIVHKKMPTLVYKASIACLWFPLYFYFWKKFLKSVFDDNKFDAIHLHDLPLAKVAKEFSTKHNLPFILDLHENRPAIMQLYNHVITFPGKLLVSVNRWFKYQEKYVKLADRLILVTKEAKENFLVEYRINPKRVVVVPNYADLQKIRGFTFDDKIVEMYKDKYTLIYFGDTGFRRGTKTILTAASKLKQISKIHFIIIGKSKDDDQLKKMIIEQDINNVDLLGWISIEKAVSYMKAARIGLCPFLRNKHHDTTYANKMFQYMAFGKPVIVSDCTAQKNIVETEDCGLVFKAGDADDLALKIEQIYNDDKQYSVNAKSIVNEKYNWKLASINLLELYDHFE